MLKKILIGIIVVVAVGGGLVYWQQSHKTGKVESATTKFLRAEDVKSSDLIVQITEQGFVPSALNIKRGQKVVFVNKTQTWAWPASDPHPVHTNYVGFDPQEPLDKNEAWAFIFDKVGKWSFHDHLIPSKKGEIIVSD